jgi:hypothetical protein
MRLILKCLFVISFGLALLDTAPAVVIVQTLPPQKVAAYWDAVMKNDFSAAYKLYSKHEKQAFMLSKNVPEADRQKAFDRLMKEQARNMRLTEVGVGRIEIPQGKTFSTADKCLVLSTVKGEMLGKDWKNSRSHSWQENLYWFFKRTDLGWQPMQILRPENISKVMPGPRTKIGRLSYLLINDAQGVAIVQVDDVKPIKDTRAEIAKQESSIAAAHLRRERLAIWMPFYTTLVAGLLLLIFWLAFCARRPRPNP